MKILLRNKKGAALVSVLIGILFIAILASSLLYMSTMNYQMKSMHQFSTDNFFTAEYALDDMVAQLKQYSSIQADPHGALETLLKTTDGGHTVFNAASMINLIDVSSYVEGLDPAFGTNGVQISSIYGTTQDTYVDDGTYIHLRGVQVTVKTDAAHGNYKSTITTDIDLGFPARGGSTAGLNDFSVLTDSCIYVKGGSQHFCGDMYCRKNGRNGRNGSKALQVGPHSIVSCMGGFNFFDGDVQVDAGGSLFIAGNCYVNGKVNIDATGQLIVGGTMYVRNAVTGTYRTVSGGSMNANNSTVDWAFYDDNFDTGLAHQLVANEIHFHLGAAHTSMSAYGFNGYLDDFVMDQSQIKTALNADGSGGTNENGKLANGTTPDGRAVHAIYLTNGVSHEYTNTLILSPVGTTRFHGNTKGCTWVCTCNDGCMEIGEDGGTAQYLNIWGNMDDVSYEAAKKLFFQASWPNNYGGALPKFGGTNKSMDDLVSDDGTVNGTEWTLDGQHLHYYTHGRSESQRYFHQTGVGADQTINYFPYECFLNDELEIVLGRFRNGLAGEGSSNAKPTIILNNWTKD